MIPGERWVKWNFLVAGVVLAVIALWQFARWFLDS